LPKQTSNEILAGNPRLPERHPGCIVVEPYSGCYNHFCTRHILKRKALFTP